MNNINIIFQEGVNLLDLFNNITNNAVQYMQMYGLWFGFSIIVLESILPWLPLFVFIALNLAAYGNVLGFIISWVATICGCIISYSFFRYLIGNRLEKFINKNKYAKVKKVVRAIEKIDFSNLVLIVALPFSPAFMINIACGITNVSFKKFLLALLIGKTVIVYFWGFIGTSLIESITDATTVITVCLLLLIAFVVSKIIVKKYNIE